MLAGRYVGRQAPVAHTVRSHSTQREPKQSDAGNAQSAHGCARPPAKRSCMDYRGRSAGAVMLNGSLITKQLSLNLHIRNTDLAVLRALHPHKPAANAPYALERWLGAEVVVRATHGTARALEVAWGSTA
jgi:hypothetical protein